MIPWLPHHDTRVFAENHLIENLQVVALLCAMIVFFIQCFFTRYPFFGIPGFLTILCIGFLLREVDIERLHSSVWLQTLGAGYGRLFLLLPWLGLLLISLRQWATLYPKRYHYLRSDLGFYTLTSGILLVLSIPMDRLSDQLTFAQYLEESFELMGYGLLLLASSKVRSSSPSV